MNNKRWGNYGNYGDTEILLMRALTEDTFDVVMVTPLPDDRARFLHTVIFCRDYLDTANARDHLSQILKDSGHENIADFGPKGLLGNKNPDEVFDYRLLASLIAKNLCTRSEMSREHALDLVYSVTDLRFTKI